VKCYVAEAEKWLNSFLGRKKFYRSYLTCLWSAYMSYLCFTGRTRMLRCQTQSTRKISRSSDFIVSASVGVAPAVYPGADESIPGSDHAVVMLGWSGGRRCGCVLCSLVPNSWHLAPSDHCPRPTSC